MLLSYFRPVYEQEPTLKPRFFQTEYIGAGKKDISSSIPVDKKPISTPYDWLQSDSDMKNNISPVEIQDKKPTKNRPKSPFYPENSKPSVPSVPKIKTQFKAKKRLEQMEQVASVPRIIFLFIK